MHCGDHWRNLFQKQQTLSSGLRTPAAPISMVYLPLVCTVSAPRLSKTDPGPAHEECLDVLWKRHILESDNHTNVDIKRNNCWEEEIMDYEILRQDIIQIRRSGKEGFLCVALGESFALMPKSSKELYIHFTSQTFRWLLGQTQCTGRFCLIYTLKKNWIRCQYLEIS